MKKISILSVIGMVSVAGAVSAETFSGSELAPGTGVVYSTSGAPFNGDSPTSAYVPTGGGYANLYTPDGNQSSDRATVSILNGDNGVSLGNLNSLITAGAAGEVSFNLLSVPIASGQAPFWQVTLADPKNTSVTMTFDTINAAPDKTSGGPTIGLNYFNQGDSMMATTSTQQGNLPFLWTHIASDVMEDGTALGTWEVTAVSVEIGGWNTTAPLDVEIGSITVPGDDSGNSGDNGNGVPDAASTLSLLGIGVGGLAALRRRLQRAC